MYSGPAQWFSRGKDEERDTLFGPFEFNQMAFGLKNCLDIISAINGKMLGRIKPQDMLGVP